MIQPPFRRVQPTRNYEQVAQQIQQAIIEGHFKPGDKLPPQKELMNLFHVSKFTIMAAIRSLEKSGLVYTKSGATGGTFVSELNTAGFSESLRLLLSMKKVPLEELAEFRLTVEGRVAYWAARRRRKEDIARMEGLLETMAAILDSDGHAERLVPVDMEFHLAVAKASRNTLFLAIMETIHECFHPIFSYVPQESWAKTYPDLVRVFQAVKARDARAAEKAIREHIARSSRLILRQFREKKVKPELFMESGVYDTF
ncbi:MAG: FadR family transcriptional regulator [Deltaproteobacteria bacterium]|nr:FadR family transcriptional regulator [Deltaproteobacteria bacterium]MBW2121062.1 FadR family transcriptional regulator [Deltaproteobacteria bacterium]